MAMRPESTINAGNNTGCFEVWPFFMAFGSQRVRQEEWRSKNLEPVVTIYVLHSKG